jgi:hypothetical protein
MENIEVPVSNNENELLQQEPQKILDPVSNWDNIKSETVDENVIRGTLEETPETTPTETPTETEIKVETTNASEQPTFNENEWFKTKSGGKYEKWEDVEVLLNKASEVQAPQFANETSKKIYEAIIAGKEDELADYFGKKQFAKTLSSQPTENVVKAYIKEQIPTLTEVELERYYQKNYGVDEESFSDEIDLSIAKKEAETKLNKVKNDALNYFNQKAEQVQLPALEVIQPEAQGVKSDLESDAAKSVVAYAESLVKSDKTFGALDIPFEYSNEKNGAKVQGKIKLDEKQISEFEQKIGDYPDAVILATYFKDGVFDKKTFARDMYIVRNQSKLLQAATAEGYNQGFLSKLQKDKNITVVGTKTGAAPEVANDSIDKARDYKWRGFSDAKILELTGIDLSKVS